MRAHTARADAGCLVVVLNEEGRILSANAGFRAMFGLRPHQTPSEPIWEALPEQSVAHTFRAMLKDKRLVASAFEKESFVCTPGGAWRRVIWSHSPVWAADGTLVSLVSAGVDVSARERDDDALRRVRRALRVISQFNEALVQASSEAVLLEAACRIAVEVGGYEFAWVGFLQDDAQRTVTPVAHHGRDGEYLATIDVSLADLEQAGGPTGVAIRTGRPQVARDVSTDPAHGAWREEGVRRGHASWIGLPLLKEGSAFGALTICAGEPDAFDGGEVELLTGLAEDLAYGIIALRERGQRELAESQLDVSEARMATLVDAVPGGVTIVDAGGRIAFANPQAERILGLSREAITERYYKDPPWRMTAADGRPLPEEELAFARVMKTGEPVYDVECAIEWPDGTRVFLSVNAAPLRGQMGEPVGVVTALTDITALKEGERKLAESEQRFRSLVEAAFDGVIIHADGVVLEADPKVSRMLGYEPGELVGVKVLDLIAPESREMIASRIGTNEGERDEAWGLRKDGTTFPFEACSRQAQYRGQTVRMVAIRDLSQRKQTEAELERSLASLRRTMEGIVSVLASTVESRDPHTAGHQRRTTELACAIARAMDWPADRIEGLRMAAAVHDLGKLSVPAEILSRPGKISELEMDIIKRHPQTGSEVLSGVEFPWPIAQAVLQHHERLDGSGYPGRLAGDEVMMEARVLAVADVVEAMASHRPYRPALGIEAALAEISQQRDKRYDPQVVDACLRLFREDGFQLSNNGT